MARIERFEDIEAWKKARVLTADVYASCRDGSFSRDFALRDQIRRSAVSVMANIAEGFGRKTNKDFSNFLHMAKASALETVSHLYVALDQDYVSESDFSRLRSEYDEVDRMLSSLVTYLGRNPGTR